MTLSVPTRSTFVAFMLAISACCVSVQAEDCEPAVDMMESNDAVNRMGDCDYSDKGLNGWFTGRDDDAREPVPAAKASSQPAAGPSAAVAERFELTRPDIKSALDLLQARFNLVAQAAGRCEGPAVLSEESYMQNKRGSTQLNMIFYCR